MAVERNERIMYKKTIDLHRVDDFMLGQACAYLVASKGLLESVVEYEYGITSADKETVKEAIEKIGKVIENYGS